MHVVSTMLKFFHSSLLYLFNRYAQDPWLWEMDWSVQDVRTKKPKPPKKKRKTKQKASSDNEADEDSPATKTSTTCESITTEILEDELIDDNNIEVVEGLKNSTDILATIPPAVDVMYKRRQKLPGYPK